VHCKHKLLNWQSQFRTRSMSVWCCINQWIHIPSLDDFVPTCQTFALRESWNCYIAWCDVSAHKLYFRRVWWMQGKRCKIMLSGVGKTLFQEKWNAKMRAGRATRRKSALAKVFQIFCANKRNLVAITVKTCGSPALWEEILHLYPGQLWQEGGGWRWVGCVVAVNSRPDPLPKFRWQGGDHPRVCPKHMKYHDKRARRKQIWNIWLE